MKCGRSAVRAVAAVVIACGIFLVPGCSLRPPTAVDRIADVSVPKTPPANSIIIFKFKPHGDPDARFYGVGFTTALGERMYCPHTSLILQRSSYELANSPRDERRKRAQQWSREAALRRGKTAGVRYILTGDALLTGDRISLSAELFDVTTGSRRADFKESGKLSELPSMQVTMAQQVVRAMGLRPDAEQSEALRQPTFAKPDTLLLTGRAYFAEGDQARELAWQSWERDPGSELAAGNVLVSYTSGRDTYRDIRKDKRLSAFLESVSRRFPTDQDINSMIAGLYAGQYQFKKAEMLLRSIVKTDPGYDYAHGLLRYVAAWRMDADLAVKEARTSVEAWPTSPFAHGALADAYELAAQNARRNHPIEELSRTMRRSWEANSKAAFDEASIAVRLDPDSAGAWRIIMRTSFDLGWSGYADRAFKEMIRIDPKDPAAYRDYAAGIARGMSASKRLDEVLALADKNLGPGSADACLVRGWVLLAGSPSQKQYTETLRLANAALTKSKESQSSALDLKAQALEGLGRMQDVLQTAKKGFETDPSPRWRTLLASGYTHEWIQAHDPAALRKAVELMTIYADEIPFDSYGHSCLGWCLSRQGLREEATKQFAWALALDPCDKYSRDALRRMRRGVFE
jgi:tetratricopeptide (TPR) repeat protein